MPNASHDYIFFGLGDGMRWLGFHLGLLFKHRFYSLHGYSPLDDIGPLACYAGQRFCHGLDSVMNTHGNAPAADRIFRGVVGCDRVSAGQPPHEHATTVDDRKFTLGRGIDKAPS